jgi:hypothetical protein
VQLSYVMHECTVRVCGCYLRNGLRSMSDLDHPPGVEVIARLSAENAMLHRAVAELMDDIVCLARMRGIPLELPPSWSRSEPGCIQPDQDPEASS